MSTLGEKRPSLAAITPSLFARSGVFGSRASGRTFCASHFGGCEGTKGTEGKCDERDDPLRAPRQFTHGSYRCPLAGGLSLISPCPSTILMPKREAYIEWDDDDDDNHSFPLELLKSATELELISPSKAKQRVYKPRKRVRQSKSSKGRAAGTVQSASAPTASCSQEDFPDQQDFPETAPPADGFGFSPPHDNFTDHSDIDSAEAVFGKNELEDYVDAVEANVVGFTHLHNDLFVVQGWDTARSESTVRLDDHAQPFHERAPN